jgi:hypothetical protein
VLKPNESISRYVKSLANLKTQFLDAIGNTVAGISSRLNACDYDPAIRNIDAFDEAYSVTPITRFVSKQFRLVGDLPERVSPRDGSKV